MRRRGQQAAHADQRESALRQISAQVGQVQAAREQAPQRGTQE